MAAVISDVTESVDKIVESVNTKVSNWWNYGKQGLPWHLDPHRCVIFLCI